MDPYHCEGLQVTPAAMAKSHTGSGAVCSGLCSCRSTSNRNFRLGLKRRSCSCSQESGTPSQSSLCRPQKRRRVASNYRFAASESVFKPTPLQDGRTAHDAINPTEGFLYGQDRPKGCVLNSTSSRRVPPSAGLSKWPGKAPAVSNSPIRALHRSLYLHETHKTSNQIFETGGSTHSRILGRHVTNSPVRIPVAPGSSNHNVAPRGPGVHNKPPQVCAHAEYTAGVSGFPNQYTDNDHSFTTGQDFRLAEGSIRIVETQSSSNQVFRMVRRETCGNQTSSLYSSTTLPSTAESEGRRHSCSSRADSPFTGGLQGLEMVDFTTPGTLLFTTAEIGGVHSDNIRCIYSGLGSSLSGSENWRSMDSRRVPITHQYVGTESSLFSYSVLFEGTGSSECLSETGQPDSNCVSEQDGQFFSDSPLSSCHSGLGLVSSSPNCFTSRIPTRRREHNRRLGIESPPGQQRLAVMPVSFRHPQPHAGSIFDRFICLQNEPPVTFILQLEARPRCMHNRCILSIMGRNDSISLPPILPGRQSSVEDTPGLGRICLPDSTGMASTTLVPTGTVNVDRLTNFASGGPRPITQYELPTQPSASGREVVPDRLAYLRQIYEAQGFSQRVAELVIESWRGNTNAAYNSAWRKWHSWCCRRGINPVSATVASIMEFLTDQFDLGLQYRTINTMRSSISTTHPGIKGTAVGSHPLVSWLMRGMFNCRPPMPRYERSWNIGTVIDFFTNHYKSASLTVLQLAKKAATLLAITNADRCSDLAALDRDHLKQTPTGVEFTVVQLTKTRSRKSSTPRKVLYHYFLENTEVCPVTVLQLYLDRTAEQASSMRSPRPVFVTSRKPIHRAKPGTIGHWIKDTLGRAGVDTETFSAHSTRSASTSHAATREVPVCDILKAANWSSQSTFERFYYRPNGSDSFQRAILQSTEETRYYTFLY